MNMATSQKQWDRNIEKLKQRLKRLDEGRNGMKKLCSYCREPYDLNHDCPLRPKGKAHRIMWVPYEDSEPKKTDPAKLDRVAWHIASIFKRSTSQNEEGKKQEATTVSRSLYDEFLAVNDQHTVDPLESKNQTLEDPLADDRVEISKAAVEEKHLSPLEKEEELEHKGDGPKQDAERLQDGHVEGHTHEQRLLGLEDL